MVTHTTPLIQHSDNASIGNNPTPHRRWKVAVCCIFLLLIVSIVFNVRSLWPTHSSDSKAEAQNSCSVKKRGTTSKELGEWTTALLSNDGAALGTNLGIQSIHTTLLPSGKVSLISGSSWRNKNPVEMWPDVNRPATGKGVFIKSENPFENLKKELYYSIVNNNGIFDPEKNTFYRIPSPIPSPDPYNSSLFLPNDLFCSGHLHLPDGNILFVGGTQYYTPFRTGSRASYLFDWKKETEIDWSSFDWTRQPDPSYNPWEFSGIMIRGRWYPHMVPLLDGRLVIFSGYVGFDYGFEDMYEFETNHYIEIFNPAEYSTSNPQAAWRVIDVKNLPNSPFNTSLIVVTSAASDCSIPRRCLDFQKDAFKLYPQNYLLNDGRIYLTREGDWNSLRTGDGKYMRLSNFTYFVSVIGTKDQPQIEFSRGPERPELITSSGTTVKDPNYEQILLTGGMSNGGGVLLPGFISPTDPLSNDTSLANQFAGSRGSRKLETFTLPSNNDPIGKWTLEDANFLGESESADRTMHYTIILPTKELLVIGGGNYDFFGPIYNPILLTPIYCDGVPSGKYEKKVLRESTKPRLYHSGAILLPDARILTVGGNAARATVNLEEPQTSPRNTSGQPKPNMNRVDLGVYFFNDGGMAKGFNVAPAENWVAEIFSPPYLFIDGDRRTKIANITWKDDMPGVGYTPVSYINGKRYLLLHSEQTYEIILENLPDCLTREGSLVLIKLGSVTHGWDSGQQLHQLEFTEINKYTISVTTPNSSKKNIVPAFYMLFYVDCAGKPSVAQMTRFDDNVDTI